MARFLLHSVSCLAAALLTLPVPSFAFETPLSDTAVREAYFLGQRHDDRLARFLDKYTKHLPPPKRGPHISAVTFYTPFALVVQDSSEHSTGYSAQQAWLDHQNQEESVEVVVQILLTDSYPALIPRPTGSHSGSSIGYVQRPYDFWARFHVQVFSRDKELKPFTSSGRPDLFCGDDGCLLTGATLELEFPAQAFDSESATVEVRPPEGESVSVEFDLVSLR
jgi:hypothetical protein